MDVPLCTPKRARSESPGDGDSNTSNTATIQTRHHYHSRKPDPAPDARSPGRRRLSRQKLPISLTRWNVPAAPGSPNDSQARAAALNYRSAGVDEDLRTNTTFGDLLGDNSKFPAHRLPPVSASLHAHQTMSDDLAVQSPGTVVENVGYDIGSDDAQSFLGGAISSSAGQSGTGSLTAGNQDNLWYELPHEAASGFFEAPEAIPFSTDNDPMKLSLQDFQYNDFTSRIATLQRRPSNTPWSPVHLSYAPTNILAEHLYLPSSTLGPPDVTSADYSSLLWASAQPSFQQTDVSKCGLYVPCLPKEVHSIFPDPVPQIYQPPSRADISCGYRYPTLSNVISLSDIQSQNPRDFYNDLMSSLPSAKYRQRTSEPWSPVNLEIQAASNQGIHSTLTYAKPQAEEQPFEIPEELLNLPIESNTSVPKISGESPADTPTDTRKDATSVLWENNTLSSASFRRAAARKSLENRRKPGRRSGPLDPESAKKASEMRKRGACWQCWLLKVPCTVDTICKRCRNLQSPLSTTPLCTRARLIDYTDLFFPPLIANRRSESSVQQLMKENVLGFTDNKIDILMLSGPKYPPIHLTAHEFIPSNQDFLAMYYVTPGADTQTLELLPSYAPPLCLRDSEVTELKDKCWEHIKLIIRQKRHYGEIKSGHTSPIVWKSYEAVDRFLKSSELANVPLLRKVVMLYAMNYFLSRIITFTNESATEVVSRLRMPTQFNYQRSKSAKLLNIQIKMEMYSLLREVTKDVLERLEKELRTRTKSSWATSFCVILILSSCVEAVQVAADGFVLQISLSRNDGFNGPNNPGTRTKVSRDEVIEICRRLDDLPFAHCVNLFHTIYRTSKSKNGQRNEKGFNPIRDGLELDKKGGLDQSTLELVDDIRKIIRYHEEELEQLSRKPSLVPTADPVADHMQFRTKNSGRLVAAFLKSFLRVT